MTTVYKHKLLMLSFQGRSPRQIYADACDEHHVHVQKALSEELSNVADDFGKLQHLLCSGIAFGVRGCLALVPIIQCSRNLRRVDLKGCGVTDEFAAHLVEGLQEHPTIRTIDLSDNPFITVHSGRGFVKMAELNPNIVACVLSGTHVGANVAKVVTSRCEANRFRLVSYFADDFFRMKDLFNSVDADGSGWVHIKNIVGSVNAPILQERLIERIALKRPKKRSDNCIHVNTFMELVYLNYKSMAEINDQCKDGTSDASSMAIKTNWKLIVNAMAASGVTCELLSKFRIRDLVLSRNEASELVAEAVQQMQLDEAAAGGGGTRITNNNNGGEDEIGDGAPNPSLLALHPKHLMAAFKVLFPPLPPAPKSYGFLKERADDYVSPLLRQGSRCVSITDMSSNATPALSQLGEDDDDPPRTWKLPPSMVVEIVKMFQNQHEMCIDTFLDATPATELEYLRVAGLCSNFAQYSIPTDVSALTLQEAVNALDEYYDVVRVDKPFSLAEIASMCAQ